MKSICILITLMALALPMPAQTANGQDSAEVESHDVASAPLQLIISGSGQVFPFHDGRMHEVGRNYFLSPFQSQAMSLRIGNASTCSPLLK